MSAFDADVNINLEFNDNATPEVQRSAKDINRSWREMRDEQRAVGRQFELNHRSFTQTARAIQFVGSAATRMINIYQAWTLSQIRHNETLRRQADLAREINQAIAEGDIQKAVDLQKELADETARANSELLDQYAFFILVASSVAGTAAQITRKLIPALTRLTGKTTPVSNIPKAGGGNVPKGTGKGAGGIGTGAKVGIGAGLTVAGLIASDILSSEDPLQRLKDIALDPLNFQGKSENKIIISVNVNGTMQSKTIDLNNPYAVS